MSIYESGNLGILSPENGLSLGPLILTGPPDPELSPTLCQVTIFTSRHECNSWLESVTPTGVQTCCEGKSKMSSLASRLTAHLTYIGWSHDWHEFEGMKGMFEVDLRWIRDDEGKTDRGPRGI